MTLEDTIKSINKYIERRRVDEKEYTASEDLVLHKSITPAPTFGAYKVIEYTVWAVDYKHNYRVYTLKYTTKMTADTEKLVLKEFEIQFLTSLLETLYNRKDPRTGKITMEEIIHGGFSGY